MIAEILTVSSGLLTGQIAGTDTQYIARRLAETGISMRRHSTVGDDPVEVRAALSEALERADIVIAAGNACLARRALADLRPERPETAPDCVTVCGGRIVALLPGPSDEMRRAFDAQLIPWLIRPDGTRTPSRPVRASGIRKPDPEDSVERAVVRMLSESGQTVSFAESLTGGLICARLVNAPGASRVLEEAHVTYSPEAKIRVLGVSRDTVERYTVVSEPCAREMAEGVRRISGADWGVSATGIAGPDGGTEAAPVGTVFIGIAGPDGTVVSKCRFRGSRDVIRALSASRALNELRSSLLLNR